MSEWDRERESTMCCACFWFTNIKNMCSTSPLLIIRSCSTIKNLLYIHLDCWWFWFCRYTSRYAYVCVCVLHRGFFNLFFTKNKNTIQFACFRNRFVRRSKKKNTKTLQLESCSSFYGIQVVLLFRLRLQPKNNTLAQPIFIYAFIWTFVGEWETLRTN